MLAIMISLVKRTRAALYCAAGKRQTSKGKSSALPRMFDYQSIVECIDPCPEIVDVVESSFRRQGKNEVDIGEPLRVGILDRNVGTKDFV